MSSRLKYEVIAVVSADPLPQGMVRLFFWEYPNDL
jgi:hypothetical protein